MSIEEVGKNLVEKEIDEEMVVKATQRKIPQSPFEDQMVIGTGLHAVRR